MGILGTIKGWFIKGANTFKTILGKILSQTKPFLKIVASEAVQQIWATSSHLLVEAVQYVATQGLPTEEASKTAFYEYMRKNGNEAIKDLRTRELNFLRELALSIVDKAKNS